MPSGLVFHKGNTLTFDSFHNDCGRHSFDSLCFVKCSFQLIHIISVCYIDHMEIKCFKFLINRIWRANFIYFSIDLKSIIINNHNKVVQFTEACEHSCLPNLTFLNLTIAKKCIHPVGFVAQFCRKCHTYCC